MKSLKSIKVFCLAVTSVCLILSGAAFSAEDDALVVDEVGNIGIGTTTSPQAKLHIQACNNPVPFRAGANSSSGSELTVDVAAGQGLANLVGGAQVKSDGSGYNFLGTRGASRINLNDGSIYFFTSDLTTGSSGAAVDGLTQGQQKMAILNTGRVGIGTANPQSKLHIVHPTQESGDDLIAGGLTLENTLLGAKANIFAGWYGAKFLQFMVNDTPALSLLENGDATFYNNLTLYNTDVSSEVDCFASRFTIPAYGIDWEFFQMNINDNRVLYIYESGNATFTGSVAENSDMNLKEDIAKIDNALEKLTALRGVYYKWKDKEKRGDQTHIGLIAQEVEAVFPEAVVTDQDGIKSICYGNLIAPLIEAIKELKTENDTLKDEVKEKNKDLQAENEMLKKQIIATNEKLKAENDTMKKELQLLKEQMLALMVSNNEKELAQK